MTNAQALKILIEHQKWRKGDETLTMKKPAIIGKALNVAIKALEALK